MPAEHILDVWQSARCLVTAMNKDKILCPHRASIWRTGVRKDTHIDNKYDKLINFIYLRK